MISDGDLADPTNPTGGPEGAEANHRISKHNTNILN
jgi:hypothetical protein